MAAYEDAGRILVDIPIGLPWNGRATRPCDQKLRVHAFYCVLALMLLNLLRRQLAQAGLPLSVVKMMDLLTAIHEVTLLYPAPPGSKKPFARTVLSDLDPTQRKLVDVLGLERYRHS